MADRAVLFIDGNNWYHALKGHGVTDQKRLDYARISEKLTVPRDWLGTRYYVGRVQQWGNTRLYSEQRQFLARLEQMDARITTHLGRLEQRPEDNSAARELQIYSANLPQRIDSDVYRGLMQIAKTHRHQTVTVEKAVDVMLAVDLVVMAERDEFDAAYLLSRDGDFTPAVAAVRAHEKKVYAVSMQRGQQLATAVNSFVTLPRDWFDDCYV